MKNVYIDARDKNGKVIGYTIYRTASSNVARVHRFALSKAQLLWPDAYEWTVGPNTLESVKESK